MLLSRMKLLTVDNLGLAGRRTLQAERGAKSKCCLASSSRQLCMPSDHQRNAIATSLVSLRDHTIIMIRNS